MPDRYRRHALALVLVSVLAMPWAPIRAQADDSVRIFVDRLIEAANDVFSSGSDDDARQKCRRMLAWGFDVPAMAQYALGDAWHSATVPQRNAFRAAFEDLIITSYLRQFDSSRGTIAFIGARPDDHGQWLAATRLIDPGRAEPTWIWRLRKSGQSWRVIDLMADGRSVLYGERQEYARVLEANDGNLNAVIEFARKRAGR